MTTTVSLHINTVQIRLLNKHEGKYPPRHICTTLSCKRTHQFCIFSNKAIRLISKK